MREQAFECGLAILPFCLGRRRRSDCVMRAGRSADRGQKIESPAWPIPDKSDPQIECNRH